jgi:hypothetical protein
VTNTREQLIERQREWERTHGPWHLEPMVGSGYVINPRGDWGDGIQGPLIHAERCHLLKLATDEWEHLTWAEVKDWERRRREEEEPMGFAGCCVAYDGEDPEVRAARDAQRLAAAQADPEWREWREQRRARLAAARAEREPDRRASKPLSESDHWGIDPDSGIDP